MHTLARSSAGTPMTHTHTHHKPQTSLLFPSAPLLHPHPPKECRASKPNSEGCAQWPQGTPVVANQRPFPQESRGADTDGRLVLLWPQGEALGWLIMSQDCSCPAHSKCLSRFLSQPRGDSVDFTPLGYHPQFSGPLSWFQAGVTCCLSVVLASPGPLPSPASSSSCSQAFAPS